MDFDDFEMSFCSDGMCDFKKASVAFTGAIVLESWIFRGAAGGGCGGGRPALALALALVSPLPALAPALGLARPWPGSDAGLGSALDHGKL